MDCSQVAFCASLRRMIALGSATGSPLVFQSSTRRRKTSSSLGGQSLALIGPFERFGHGAVVIVDEGKDFGLQVLNRSVRSTLLVLAWGHAWLLSFFTLVRDPSILQTYFSLHVLAPCLIRPLHRAYRFLKRRLKNLPILAGSL